MFLTFPLGLGNKLRSPGFCVHFHHSVSHKPRNQQVWWNNNVTWLTCSIAETIWNFGILSWKHSLYAYLMKDSKILLKRRRFNCKTCTNLGAHDSRSSTCTHMSKLLCTFIISRPLLKIIYVAKRKKKTWESYNFKCFYSCQHDECFFHDVNLIQR